MKCKHCGRFVKRVEPTYNGVTTYTHRCIDHTRRFQYVPVARFKEVRYNVTR